MNSVIDHPRRRILFAAEAVTLAHVTRPFVLASSLDAKCYEVWFACSQRYDDLVRAQARIHLRPIRSMSSAQFLENARRGRPLFDYDTLSNYVLEDLEVIDEIRPDLVISDFRLSLSVSARVAATPCATISNVYYYPFAKQQFPMPELAINRYWGRMIGSFVYHTVRPFAFAYHTFPLNRLRRRYGLSPLGYSLRRTLTDADFVLYADIPALGPLRELQTNHLYLGPVLWSPDVELPEWWQDIPTDNPVLYVSLGSSGPASLLPIVLRGLADLPVTVIAVTAGQARIESLPDNIYLADYLPGDLSARKADLVICNGGSPTTYQALAAGKPVLGIPSNFDQHLNMQSVARAGFGLSLRSDMITTNRIKGMVSRMLNSPRYKHVAMTMAAEIEEYHSPTRFRRFVDSFFHGSLNGTNSERD